MSDIIFINFRPKFYDIVSARGTGTKGYHSAPYVATVLNSMLGCYYFALKNENKLFLVTNIIEFEVALIYLTIFYLYSEHIYRVCKSQITMLKSF